jgi:thiamine biosynthesis protein ThiS
MDIVLNGQMREISENLTIAELLGELALQGPLAVEVNKEVCPKRQHGETRLQQGDELEIVTIVGGG